jgi:cytochrome c oxidase subunit I+III
MLLGAWALTLLARRWNRADWSLGFYGAIVTALALAAMGGTALLIGPWATDLSPTRHVYPAIVWLLVIWTAFQVAVGMIMHGYCLGRRMAGHMTARYDVDISVVALYWHFTALTAAMTVMIVAGFPLVFGC